MKSKRSTRKLACQLAAQVCEGHLPTGTTLLSYIILFENYIDEGANETGAVMGWDVVEKPVIQLSAVRGGLLDALG